MTKVTNNSSYLRTAMRNAAADEAKHDHTHQRDFERTFESRDLTGSRASVADSSDGGRGVALMIRNMDESSRESRHIAAIMSAAARLPRRRPWMKSLLWAIYRNGSNRRETICELGISRATYFRGLKYFLTLFSPNEISTQTHSSD